MSKKVRLFLVFILFLLLVLVRAFESKLFYDPLIEYFKNDYLYNSAPSVKITALVLSMFFRYLINSIISVAIIYFLFIKRTYIKFSVVFFLVLFCFLMPVFVYLLMNDFNSGYLVPFYIRRFLLHPLFLLVLLPAFYYQKLSDKSLT